MKIEPLAQAHDRGGFRCGISSFDKYLRAQAGRDTAKSLSAVFVAALPSGKVAGYYALSSATVQLPDLLGSGDRVGSRYPVLITARLTKLAVDKRHCGQGFGAAMLRDMVARLQALPFRPMALIADVQNEAARHFLEHAGFRSFTDQPQRAFRVLP
jgi:ribosomal protein S18 acetylase RimI-like enzyme